MREDTPMMTTNTNKFSNSYGF